MTAHRHAHRTQSGWQDYGVAFTVQLKSENGDVLDEFMLLRLPIKQVPAPHDRTSPVLRFVDPYGDTILNSSQAAALVAELNETEASDQEQHQRLIEMASRCAGEVHEYLWFVGD
jgi:hypothetical protein